MDRYRQKSNIVEAVQFNADIHPWPETVIPWKKGHASQDGSAGYVVTSEGRAHVHATDWIVKGASGTLHVCKDAVFQSTYEPVEEQTTLKRHVLKRAVVNNDTFRSGTKGDLHDRYPTD